MYSILEGLCRKSRGFSSSNSIRERIAEIEQLGGMSGVDFDDGDDDGDDGDGERKEDMSTKLDGEDSEDDGDDDGDDSGEDDREDELHGTFEEERLRLYQKSCGKTTVEPQPELLVAELLEEFDEVYRSIYCPGSKGQKLHPYELTISDEELEGVSSHDVDERADAYMLGIVRVAKRWADTAAVDPGLSQHDKSIYRQLPNKLRVLLRWGMLDVPGAPRMPLMTRSVVKMILRRFGLVDDALQEVSLSVFVFEGFQLSRGWWFCRVC